MISILTVLVMGLVACGGNSTVASWTTSGTLVNDSLDESWTLSIGQANGNIRRDARFNQQNLDFFFVRASIGSGNATLTITQGSNETIIDLSDGMDGFISTAGLGPGNIRLRLDFDNATDVEIEISWEARFFF